MAKIDEPGATITKTNALMFPKVTTMTEAVQPPKLNEKGACPPSGVDGAPPPPPKAPAAIEELTAKIDAPFPVDPQAPTEKRIDGHHGSTAATLSENPTAVMGKPEGQVLDKKVARRGVSKDPHDASHNKDDGKGVENTKG